MIPIKSGAPAPNWIAFSDSQIANLCFYVTNTGTKGCQNEGGMNQPTERSGKIGN